MTPTRRMLMLATASLVTLLPLGARAQPTERFPSRPVTIIVPTPAGGPSDMAARLVGKSLSVAWGQPVIVDNKPGANGAIAARALMAAMPDGYTLLWGQAAMAGLPFLQRDMPYRTMTELTPVSNVLSFGYALFINRDLPMQNFADLVAYGRTRPGRLSFATGTLSEYMVAEHVLKSVGVDAVRMPYQGGAQLMPDLISGQVQINFGPILSGLRHVKSGQLKMLAAGLPQRSDLLPDVPTFTELGVPDGTLPTWNGLFAPAGTPPGVVDRIATAVAQSLRDPALRAPLEANGVELLGSTPQQLAVSVDAATTAWRSFARDYKIAQE